LEYRLVKLYLIFNDTATETTPGLICLEIIFTSYKS